MNKRNLGLILVIVILLGYGLTQIDFRQAGETRALTLPANGIKELHINAGSGNMIIVGDEEATEIVANAEITRQGLGTKRNIKIELKQEKEIATLNTNVKSFLSLQSVRIDITVTIPARLALTVSDDSGDISIENVYV